VNRAKSGKEEFVAVFERRAFDQYFGRIQDTWSADEDLDEYVHRMYAMIDEYPDGLVTYPGPASAVLGLQWRLGATYEEVKAAVRQLPADSTAVFGVFEGSELWATLVLGFDGDRRAKVVTTVDPSQLASATTRSDIARNVVEWTNRRYPPCSLGLFMSRESAKAFLSGRDKGKALAEVMAKGDLIAEPVPASLARVFAAR